MRLLAGIVQDRLNGPRVLHDAWAAGQVSDGDLRTLIPDTWLYVDWPERVIGTGKWVQMFRAAGFLSIPYGLSRPEPAITVFRGATEERRAAYRGSGGGGGQRAIPAVVRDTAVSRAVDAIGPRPGRQAPGGRTMAASSGGDQ
jgi:hypothetical protein